MMLGLEMFHKNRLSEIATMAIDWMIEEDRDRAIQFLHDDLSMTIEELEYFGVELYEDELNEYCWERMCPICGAIYDAEDAVFSHNDEAYICEECANNRITEDFEDEDDYE